MNIAAIVHESKSRYAYMYDEFTVHLRIKVAKNDVVKGKVLSVDPFSWFYFPDEDTYKFDKSKIITTPLKLIGTTETHDVWEAQVKDVDTKRMRYTFVLEDNDKNIYSFGQKCLNVTDKLDKLDGLYNSLNFPYLNHEDMYNAPNWVKDVIWYQVTLSSYSNDGKPCLTNTEGTIKGMIEKLDYILDMGFNGIYFTPIFEAFSWHKYDTTDYTKVAKEFGTNEEFKEFVNLAHKKGIKVMLDGVFNHCGPLHPFWQDVIKNGKNSKYFDCFFILDETKEILSLPLNEDGSYPDVVTTDLNFRTFGFASAMPKINASHPLWKEHILEVGKMWVRDYNIDGWRLDVSNEVSHQFWRDFCREVRSLNKDTYIMGENWDDSYAWLSSNQFDSVMNYQFMNAVWGVLNRNIEHKLPLSVSEYTQSIDQILTMYPKNVNEHMFNLISSHDVDRITTIMNSDMSKVKLAFLLLFTYGGSPCVFYGDEVAMKGPELGNRTPMIWDESEQDVDLKEFVRKMIKLRKENACFKDNDINWELVDDSLDVLIFSKQHLNEKCYVVINFSSNEQVIKTKLLDGVSFDLYNGIKTSVRGEISLKGSSFVILK